MIFHVVHSNRMKKKEILKIVSLPVLVASLCCLSPIILVLFGVSTVAFATSLTDTLYGTYKWAFRSIGLLALMLSLVMYFRQKGVCTIDQAKKRKKEVINIILLSIIAGIIGYIVWLYVVVEIIGKWLGIWG
jgi:amino acid transporter